MLFYLCFLVTDEDSMWTRAGSRGCGFSSFCWKLGIGWRGLEQELVVRREEALETDRQAGTHVNTVLDI